MALKFAKHASGASKSSTSASNDEASSPKKNFLKTGAQAKELYEEAEAQAEMRKEMSGRMFRFRMKEGEERRITFLDGDMDDDGMLSAACYYEHTIQHNGGWQNIVCTADSEDGTECPICKEGKYPNYFAAALTVLDHTPYKVKNGPNAGKIIKNSKMLFVMKLGTYKQLSKLAAKRGGLAGTTWDVMRNNDKDPAVGAQFDFVEKIEDGQELMDKYGLELEQLNPANYAEEIVYVSPEELSKLGIGEPVSKNPVGGEKKLTEKDFSNEL